MSTGREPIAEVVAALVGSGGSGCGPLWRANHRREPGDDALLTLGAAVELLHTFALVRRDGPVGGAAGQPGGARRARVAPPGPLVGQRRRAVRHVGGDRGG
jgi:hypothetical protein